MPLLLADFRMGSDFTVKLLCHASQMSSGHLQNGMMPVSSHGGQPQMPGGMVPIGNSIPPGGDYKMEAMSNPYGAHLQCWQRLVPGDCES